MKIEITNRWAALALALGVGLALWAGAAYARAGGETRADATTITACVASDGTVKIPQLTICPAGQTKFVWNKQGPQGAQGPQGPAGISGLQLVRADSNYGTFVGAAANCPAGKKLIGGGAQTRLHKFESGSNADGYGASLMQSYPNSSLTSWVAWKMDYTALDKGHSGKVVTWAICANVGG
jgi:hypothetical protein